MTVSDWLKDCHVSMEARHSARPDQNFTSVNEHVTLDGVVYSFSFEFTSDTVQEPLLIFFCRKHVPWYSRYNFFLEGKRKFDEEKFTSKTFLSVKAATVNNNELKFQ